MSHAPDRRAFLPSKTVGAAGTCLVPHLTAGLVCATPPGPTQAVSAAQAKPVVMHYKEPFDYGVMKGPKITVDTFVGKNQDLPTCFFGERWLPRPILGLSQGAGRRFRSRRLDGATDPHLPVAECGPCAGGHTLAGQLREDCARWSGVSSRGRVHLEDVPGAGHVTRQSAVNNEGPALARRRYRARKPPR